MTLRRRTGRVARALPARAVRPSLVSPFAVVTSFGAATIGISGMLDGLTSTPGRLGEGWSWGWTVMAVLLTVIPVSLGRRFPRPAGLVGCWVFLAVTTVQVATSQQGVLAINNVVLYPMVFCYLGWFFARRVAWPTMAVGTVGTGTAVVVNPQPGVTVTWINVALVSLFCLTASSYLHRRLSQQARSDPLTGALNRAGLRRQAHRDLEAAVRHERPLIAVVIDLDGFKIINDHSGHARGDEVLVELVATMTAWKRPADSVGRIGGDEFAVLLPATTPDVARARVAVLAEMSTARWSHGVAASAPGDTVDSLFDRADRLLYAMKRERDL